MDKVPTLLSIPSPFSKLLVEKFLPYAIVKSYAPGRKLVISSKNVNFCYLVIEGDLELHRPRDDLVVVYFKAPAIVGLANLTEMMSGSYIKALSSCKIGIIPTNEAFDIIEKENLWRPLAEHFIVITAKLYTMTQLLSAPTTYEIVRAQLLELMSEDEKFRNATTAESYIRYKTNLSRSGVMKILSSLKLGGHIETERGILKKVNSLPKKY